MARIAELMGRPLMPWQRLVVDVALEVQSEAAGDPEPGEWAYDDVTVTVQRQAGKTTMLRPVVAHRCGSRRAARVFATAQKREKARQRWMDATDDFLTSPLREDVRRKTSRMGEELRWRLTQSTFVPFGPDEEDMHGETPDLVLVDELWAFGEGPARALQAAYQPGFLTKDAQAWKFSTAGTALSWWLNSSRAAGRRAVEQGVRLGTAFFEWSLPDEIGGVPVAALPDRELVEACIAHHPAVGFTARPAAVRSAWSTMVESAETPEERLKGRASFIRAYGNITQDQVENRWQVIDAAAFVRSRDDVGIPKNARVALGVSVADDGDQVSTASGWRSTADQRMHAELLAVHGGVAEAVPYVLGVVERQSPAAVAVLGTKAARDVADRLEAAGVPVQRVSAADHAAAVARHQSELTGGTWVHRDPLEGEPLKDAAARALLTAGRVWAGAGGPVTALGACTLAGWGFDHAPEPERPLGRFKIR